MEIPPTTPETQRIRCAQQLPCGSNLNTPAGLNGLPQTLYSANFPTTRDFHIPEQIVRTTEHIPSHPSSYTASLGTDDSMTGFSIRLYKPQPTQGTVIFLRIENSVYLDIDFPLRSPAAWNAVQVPSTASIKRVDALSRDKGTNPLTLDIIVRGAAMRQLCDRVCDQCEERVGQRMGRPSLIDFRGPSNIIRPEDGTAHIQFTFCCYSRHHQKEDEQFTYVAMALMMS